MTDPTQAAGPPNLRSAPSCADCRHYAFGQDERGYYYSTCIRHTWSVEGFDVCDDYAEDDDD